MNRADARFCDGCGAPLPLHCPGCGRESRADARFCDGCGAALGDTGSAPAALEPAGREPRAYTPRHLAEKILNQRAALEGERKHVTVLFADVAGSTQLAERAGPERMHALMDRCFQLILDEVHRYEGTINQFTGDGVMALFGAPLALEDAPRRAVLAALAVQRALAPLDDEVQRDLGLPFRWRIGIHSGPVVVGRIGDDLRMDYTAVGDTTNLAARLEQEAPPGAVLISQATEHLVSGFFELRDLGARAVKGKSVPVRAFQVLSEQGATDRIEAAVAGGLTPLVGRENELSSLSGCFEAARGGRGQLVMVVGEAGIGKSRLLYEFRSRLEDQPHFWIEGRCSPYGATAPFQAIADALRRSAGVRDDDDEAATIAKLERATVELGDDLAWTLPFMRQLLSLPAGDERIASMDAMDRRSETYRAIQARFLRASERRTVILAVEDLHWIDAASQEFLAFLTDSVPTARALIVVTYRPGYEHPFGDRSYHVRLTPQALSTTAMSAMAGSLLEASQAGALPPQLIEMLVEKAEGNPLFVEEVVRSLLEEGVLRLGDGGVELTRRLEDISVPNRIQDVLMARIDRLAEEPKRAIQLASVIGREFALRLLAEIQQAGDRVQDAIGELRELELIYEKKVHPELAFMFKHALTHDVAYDSILQARRKTLHGIVGAAIEQLYEDRLAEHYEALAHHFERAEDWERALHYHERAAEKAAVAYASRSVAEHCGRALAIAERLGDPGLGDPELDARRRALEERLGSTHFEMSEFSQSAQAFARAAAIGGERQGRNLGRAALSFVWAHEYTACAETAAKAIGRGGRSEDLSGEAFGRAALDLCDVARFGPGARGAPGDEAVAAAERSGDIEAIALTISQRALFLEQLGHFREAKAAAEGVLQRGRDARLSLMTVYPRWALGLSLTCLGEYGAALDVFSKALEDSDRCGDRALKARLINTLGWCHAEFGSHRVARELNTRGEELAAELVRLEVVEGAPEVLANAAINLANNHIDLGDAERALALLAPLQQELTQPGDPWQRWRYQLHLEHALGRAALALGDPEAVLTHADAELAGARVHGLPKLESRALELRGRALVAMDRRDEAEHALHDALIAAEQIGYQAVCWRSDALLGELARRRGRADRAEQHAGAARSRVAAAARSLPQGELSSGLLALGERLATDPLGERR